jgi:predicted nucleotidyltransferase
MKNAVLTREQAIERLHSVEQQIRRLGVRRLALFGSVVRNQATPTSDVDILVEFEPAMKNLETFLGLAFLLDEVLGRRADVVTTEALSPYIGPHILREAEDVLRAA